MPSRDRLEPRAIALLLALAAGAALALAALPSLYRVLPSDLSRTGTIVRALIERRPETVVFGDSRAQAAVDAGSLPSGSLNLAAPDQSIPEILLLADSLPATVRSVFVFVTPEETSSRSGVPRLPANALWISGLRPSRSIIDSLVRCTNDPPFLSPLAERIEARWVVRQALDTTLRDLLRPSLPLRRQREDLEFPSLYHSPLPSRRLEADLTRVRSLEIGPLHPTRACLLGALRQRLDAGGARLVLVIPPIHPRAIPEGYAEFPASMRLFSRVNGIELLDLTKALPLEAFADARHLTWAGAERFTAILRQKGFGGHEGTR